MDCELYVKFSKMFEERDEKIKQLEEKIAKLEYELNASNKKIDELEELNSYDNTLLVCLEQKVKNNEYKLTTSMKENNESLSELDNEIDILRQNFRENITDIQGRLQLIEEDLNA